MWKLCNRNFNVVNELFFWISSIYELFVNKVQKEDREMTKKTTNLDFSALEADGLARCDHYDAINRLN